MSPRFTALGLSHWSDPDNPLLISLPVPKPATNQIMTDIINLPAKQNEAHLQIMRQPVRNILHLVRNMIHSVRKIIHHVQKYDIPGDKCNTPCAKTYDTPSTKYDTPYAKYFHPVGYMIHFVKIWYNLCEI